VHHVQPGVWLIAAHDNLIADRHQLGRAVLPVRLKPHLDGGELKHQHRRHPLHALDHAGRQRRQ
jgi:hypothetical protein